MTKPQSSARWWAKNILLPLFGAGGLVTAISFFVGHKSDDGKPQSGQQVTVTINLTDQLRNNLALAVSPSAASSDHSLDPVAQKQALAALKTRSSQFRTPENAPLWLRIALKELGQTRAPGEQSNPRIFEYLRATNLPEDLSSTDKTPWSAAFISWAYQKAGIAAPKTGTCASFQTWGRRIEQGTLGALALVSYSKVEGEVPRANHVGFFLMDLGDTVLIVAGNTQNTVRVQAVDKQYIIEYRVPSEA